MPKDNSVLNLLNKGLKICVCMYIYTHMYIYTQQGLRLHSVVEYLDVFVCIHQNISVLNVSNRGLYIHTSIHMHINIHTTGAEAPLGGGISRCVCMYCHTRTLLCSIIYIYLYIYIYTYIYIYIYIYIYLTGGYMYIHVYIHTYIFTQQGLKHHLVVEYLDVFLHSADGYLVVCTGM